MTTRQFTSSKLLLAALTLFALPWGTGVAAPVLNRPAPPLAIATLEGQPFDLGALRGKVVVVSFWATWCAPCRLEMPMLDSFYKRHRDQGLELMALSIDFRRDREKARRMMARYGLPAALVSEASANGFGMPDGVPLTYVIDARGVVRERLLVADEARLTKAVLRLLDEAGTGGK